MPTTDPDFDPELDLVLERTVPVSASTIWRCWTEPKLMEVWFCPRPWRIAEIVQDLRPGGKFESVMYGPDGEQMPMRGCYLEVVPERRIVFTDTLLGGFRPAENPFFTGIVNMEPDGDGTRYTAIARHGSAASRQKHAEMGFHDGWGTALDQLVELARTL